MIRVLIALAALALGATAVLAQQAVAVQQLAVMGEISKPFYGVLARMSRERAPYDQAAIDAALAQIEVTLAKIPAAFAVNPKEDVVDATYGSSKKIWENKADFDGKVQPVLKAIADAKNSIKDLESLKVGYRTINTACDVCHETYRVKLK